MNTNDNAANALEGRTLKGKWKVKKRIEPERGATGGFFSVCYIVNDGTRDAFLKALNFNAFFQMFAGRSVVEIISEQTEAFKFEKELLLRCKNSRLSKVSMIIDEGEEFIDGYTISNVPFLIFEIADGDVRTHMNFNANVDVVWKLQSLHNVVVGIRQLHGIGIGHQDLKPSNVLLYESGLVSKIGDLGRSLCEDIEAPHENDGNFPGEFTYAPPEFLYRHIEPDWNLRVKATDFFLFGSLVAFYFTGTNMTALIAKNIDPRFRWDVWREGFDAVQAYLIDGFYKALDEFELSLPNKALAKELRDVLEYCCFPHPEKRGDSRSTLKTGNKYDLQRTVSKFDVLAKKAQYNLL